ncbi:hypothetical protein [Idiomarina sp. ST10R2A5]|uniref:hypothetical protein n=1 Tax=Idiomarina sp. ST10R2A5 TaxID=3418368 RepID=UPI003EC772ED
MDLYFERKELFESLELLIQCASKFAEDNITREHFVALVVNPNSLGVTLTTHVQAQPAQACCTLKVMHLNNEKNLSIEVSALELKNILSKISSTEFVKLAFNVDDDAILITAAMNSDDDLFEKGEFAEAPQTTRYYVSFKSLSNRVEYDLESPLLGNSKFNLSAAEAILLFNAWKANKEIAGLNARTVALTSTSLYSAYFFAPLATNTGAPSAVCVLQMDALRVLSKAAILLTKQTEPVKAIFSQNHVYLYTRTTIVKVISADASLLPASTNFSGFGECSVTAKRADIAQAIDNVDISNTAAQTNLYLRFKESDNIEFELTSKHARAKDCFALSQVEISPRGDVLKFSLSHLKAALELLDDCNLVRIKGLDKEQPRALVLSDSKSERQVLLPCRS